MRTPLRLPRFLRRSGEGPEHDARPPVSHPLVSHPLASHHPEADPVEGFRVLGPVDDLEAGYRWGAVRAVTETAAGAARVDRTERWASFPAQHGCDYVDPPAAPTDTEWSRSDAAALVPVGPGGLPGGTGHPWHAGDARDLPAVRQERMVLALATRTEVLTDAVEALQARLDEVAERFVDVVTHEDLVEVESRRARLSAEVSRLAIELRGELDRRLSELGRVVAEANHRAATVDHRGPLDLAEDRRLELHTPIAHLVDRQPA